MTLNIYTDHKNLVYFITTKILNRRQIRWAEILEKYKFTIYYIPEKNNNKINIFSRRPDLIEKKQETHLLLKLHPDDRIIEKICQLNATFIIKQNNLEIQYINNKKQVKDQDVK